MIRAISSRHPALIVIGGFAGTGKTTLCRRLAAELRVPRLGSDTMGRTIRRSEWFDGDGATAYRIGYDVLWRLCEECLQLGVPVIIDTNMGREIFWQRLDSVRANCPEHLFLPIILRCPRDACIERIRERHASNPTYYGPPEEFMTESATRVWEFLDQLDRLEIHFVDASRSQDEVYEDVRAYVTNRLITAS